MTTTGLEECLAPVRAALLDDARAEADRLVDEARHHADELVAAAQAEVDEQIAASRRRAALGEQARTERELGRARADAHRAVLEAERELRDRWIERVHGLLPELGDSETGGRLVRRLEQLARSQLGDDLTIEYDADGGLIGVAGSRRVDYRLSTLADRAVELLAEEAAASWS